MIQPDLFTASEQPRGLPCAFGTYHHSGESCPGCEAYSAELRAQFKAAVARGEYDEAGYRPAERRAQQAQKGTG